MQNRREILSTAMKAAGLAAVPTTLVASAATYVRTDAQRGTLTDEINRFRAELFSIAEGFEINSATRTMAAILGTWANLDRLRNSQGHPRIQELKGQTAFYAGTLSITLGDRTNGARWFDLGHRYAMIANARGLNSIGHFREAIAGCYWARRTERVITDTRLALKDAQTSEQKGMACMAWARALGETGTARGDVVASVNKALEHATPNSGIAPRPDSWWTHQAEMMAAVALSRFGGMLGAVENYVNGALAGLPNNAVLLRTHMALTLADAYASDREHDEAATRALVALRSVPFEHRQPVLLGRAYGLLKRLQTDSRCPYAATRLDEGLRALRGRA